jgi:hypothetical protein
VSSLKTNEMLKVWGHKLVSNSLRTWGTYINRYEKSCQTVFEAAVK